MMAVIVASAYNDGGWRLIDGGDYGQDMVASGYMVAVNDGGMVVNDAICSQLALKMIFVHYNAPQNRTMERWFRCPCWDMIVTGLVHEGHPDMSTTDWQNQWLPMNEGRNRV